MLIGIWPETFKLLRAIPVLAYEAHEQLTSGKSSSNVWEIFEQFLILGGSKLGLKVSLRAPRKVVDDPECSFPRVVFA